MMPASTKKGGNCLAMPDVCKMPTPGGPVPTPYPNMAQCNQASGGTCGKKVKFGGKKVIVQGTKIPMSSGDEAGSIGGMVSNKIKGECKYKTASSKAKIGGKKIVYVGCMIGHNGSNANMPAGAQVAPSQTKVKVMP